MQDKLEHIVADIYALEPSLKDSDEAVRTLVSELMTAKPTIAIDSVFLRTLKAELMKPAAVTHAPVVAVPSPWWMYMTPLAAMAVLVLILVPTLDKAHSPVEAPVMQTEMYMEADDAAGTMKRSGAAPAVEEASMMMLSDAPATSNMATADSFVVGMYVPGDTLAAEFVTVSMPSFLVVTNAETGAVLGVSELVLPGTYDVVMLSLTTPTEEGETYFMTLYYDDGDGIFSAETDGVVYDSYGSELKQPFYPGFPEVR